jgi:hypothetical protein
MTKWDQDQKHFITNGTCLINAVRGGLFGNGKGNADPQGKVAEGDRISVLLYLDASWMRLDAFPTATTSGADGVS